MRFPYPAMFGLLLGTRILMADAPGNDNFINAIALSGTNVTIGQSSVGATKEIGEPNHGAPGGASVWWTWTAPAAGSVIIQTTGSAFDTLLAIYTASSVVSLSDSLVASNDDNGGAKTSLVGFNVTAGTVYEIAVDGYNGASGDIRLQLFYRAIPLPPVPANDLFANRIELSGPVVSTTGANYYASKEAGEPAHADELGGASVWWSWTAPASGMVTIDTAGSRSDTLLAVYTGSVLTNLVLIASNDDVSTNLPTSSVTFQASPLVTYQIAVDGFDGAQGDIQLNIQMNAVSIDRPHLLADGAFQLTARAPAGQRLAFEASANLSTWERMATLPNVDGVVQFTDVLDRLQPRRFYRVLPVP